ncbi:hypothetical protein [Streptomyces venezuelae]|uniref:hypothetical protein n=1 Tax=Streptomyces venezuelae TaxID=54571 RepID=UPI0037BB1A41
MHIHRHTVIAAVGLATAGVLTAAAVPATAADRALDTEVAVVTSDADDTGSTGNTEDTGECLGLSGREATEKLPDLTTLIGLGLPKLRHDEGRQCFEKATSDRDNPIAAVLGLLTLLSPDSGRPASRPVEAARADDTDTETDTDTDVDEGVPAGLVGEVLNKLCVRIPVKANVPQIAGLTDILAIKDLRLLSASKTQQCTNDSPQAKNGRPVSR